MCTGLSGVSWKFYSGRDPQVAGTMKVFLGAADYLLNTPITDTEIEDSVVSVLGVRDIPCGPPEWAKRVLINGLRKLPEGFYQRERDMLFETRISHIRKAGELLKAALESPPCVVIAGNEQKIREANEELGLNLTCRHLHDLLKFET
jgi:hypothetical protein